VHFARAGLTRPHGQRVVGAVLRDPEGTRALLEGRPDHEPDAGEVAGKPIAQS
jgi:hypothetical protein